jgi:hypothetical protein
VQQDATLKGKNPTILLIVLPFHLTGHLCFFVIIVDFIIAFPFTCSFMRAASIIAVFTIDTPKPSSCAIVDKLYPPSYLCIILIFISESMGIRFRDGLLIPSVAHLPPGMAQSTKIF